MDVFGHLRKRQGRGGIKCVLLERIKGGGGGVTNRRLCLLLGKH